MAGNVSDQAAEAARIAREAAAARARALARENAKKAAQKAAQKQQAKAIEKTAKPEADRAEGLLSKVVDGVKDGAKSLIEAAQEAHELKLADTKKGVKALEAGFDKAEKPADVAKLAEKARALQESAGSDASLPETLRHDVNHLAAKAERADAAVTELQNAKQALDGTGPEKAAATARLLSRGVEVRQNLEGLQALKGTPLAEKAREVLPKIAKAATPEKLAETLGQNPDLTQYPPEAAGDMARLRGLDPKLDAALDRSAQALLDKPGGLTLDEVKANPGYGQLLAGSQDPAVQSRVAEVAKGWAHGALDRALDGKEGEDGVKEAMDAYKQELVDVAGKTGLGSVLQGAATTAVSESHDQIEDTMKKGQGLFSKITGAIGDVVGDVGGFLGDIAKPLQGALDGAFGGLGDVLKKGTGLIGEGLHGVISIGAKINPLNLTAKLAAKGLDAVGLDGAANVLNKGSELMEKGADFVGQQAENFTRGVGDAAGGIVTGVGTMVTHPVQTVTSMAYLATHPKALGEVGKALWKEGTQHGVAGAIGYIAGNAAPMLLSGGAAGGALVGKGGELINAASKMGEAGGLAKGASVLVKGAGVAMKATGEASGFGGKAVQAFKDVRQGAKFRTAIDTMLKPTTEVAQDVGSKAVLGFRDQIGAIREGLRDLKPGTGPKTLDLGKAPEPEAVQRVRAEVSNAIEEKGSVRKVMRQDLAVAKEAVKDGQKGVRDTGFEITERLQRVFEAARKTKTFKAADGGAKVAAHGIRAVTNPTNYLVRQADKLAEKLINPEIFSRLKGSVQVSDLPEARQQELLAAGLKADDTLSLTVGREVLHDTLGKLNTQVASTEEFQAQRAEANAAIRQAALAGFSWL